MRGWIGIAGGDVTGIGPEVTLKAFAALPSNDPTRWLVLSDPGYWERTARQLGISLELRPFAGEQSEGRFFIHSPLEEALPVDLTPGSPAAARAALACLREGGVRCLRQDLDALVTAPVNKEAILRSGEAFVGQTEYLSLLSGSPRTAMMLLGHDPRGRWLRVVLVTTHLPLKSVAESISREKIEGAIELASMACRDLKLGNPRIVVCGLNPHAGEGGELGREEIDHITPAIESARGRGIEVEGPVPADTAFYKAYRGDYQVVVAMYHDQGLGPLKMIAFETGVNWTLGLPFIRTSPDHGTAYDIVGRGTANPGSMLEAMRLARTLAGSR